MISESLFLNFRCTVNDTIINHGHGVVKVPVRLLCVVAVDLWSLMLYSLQPLLLSCAVHCCLTGVNAVRTSDLRPLDLGHLAVK